MAEQCDADDDYKATMDECEQIIENVEEPYIEEYSDYEDNDDAIIVECTESENDNENGLSINASDVPLSRHSLVITEGIDGSTIHHCRECRIVFESIEDFMATHNNEDHNMNENDVDVIPPTWQLVNEENDHTSSSELVDDEVERKVNCDSEEQQKEEEDEDTSDKYFCNDCHSVFEDLMTAEQHECTTRNGTCTEESTENAKRTTPISYSERVACEICNTVFNNLTNLKFHMRIHEKRKLKSIQDVLPAELQRQYNELHQFYCEICNKSFDHNLLTVHKKMHMNVEQYTCSVCNRKFDNKSNYEMHIKIHKLKKTSTVKAEQFGKRVEIQNDTEKLKYPCQFCGREFGRPYEKVKHERIHTGEKPYDCEICGKTFRVSYSLTLHLRTHTDIRPHVCEVCNKRFKSHQVYVHHLRIHSAERKYSCDICSKSFRTSVQLYSHKNSHLKPFSCSECNRPFSSLYAVRSHMKTHNKKNEDNNGKSNENIHRCRLCGAEYARLFALRLHLRETHGIVFNQQATKTTAHLDMKPLFENSENFLEADLSASDTLFDDEVAEANRAVSYLNSSEGIGADRSIDLKANNLPDDLLLSNEFCTDNFHTEEIITNW